jgi:NADH dehydrogenase
MTVLITGASGVIGRALVPRLLGRDEVRACVRRPESAEPLRAMGAKVAIGPFDQPDHLVEILPRVVTLIHLTGGPNQPDEDALFEANHRSTLIALAAAREARVPRFVLVSVPGASPEADDPFLRAKGLAEEAVATSGLEHVILRCAHVYGVGGLWFTAVVQGALADPPLAVGEGPTAPVWADDVADVLAAAEDRSAGPTGLAGTWAIEGPEAVPPVAITRALLGEDADVLPIDARVAGTALPALLGIPLAPFAIAQLLRPSRADAPDAAAAFGVRLTALSEGLRSTAERIPAEAQVASEHG